MDREKIIKGLERCSKHDGSECLQCPYFNGECTDDLMADALALLKKQEIVPVKEDKINECKCGEIVCHYWHPKFCGFCGRELLWY